MDYYIVNFWKCAQKECVELNLIYIWWLKIINLYIQISHVSACFWFLNLPILERSIFKHLNKLSFNNLFSPIILCCFIYFEAILLDKIYSWFFLLPILLWLSHLYKDLLIPYETFCFNSILSDIKAAAPDSVGLYLFVISFHPFYFQCFCTLLS